MTRRPRPPWNVQDPRDAMSTGLSLLLEGIGELRRGVDALERIAERMERGAPSSIAAGPRTFRDMTEEEPPVMADGDLDWVTDLRVVPADDTAAANAYLTNDGWHLLRVHTRADGPAEYVFGWGERPEREELPWWAINAGFPPHDHEHDDRSKLWGDVLRVHVRERHPDAPMCADDRLLKWHREEHDHARTQPAEDRPDNVLEWQTIRAGNPPHKHEHDLLVAAEEEHEVARLHLIRWHSDDIDRFRGPDETRRAWLERQTTPAYWHRVLHRHSKDEQ